MSMQHAKPICIGLNCALGADQMLPFMQALGFPATVVISRDITRRSFFFVMVVWSLAAAFR